MKALVALHMALRLVLACWLGRKKNVKQLICSKNTYTFTLVQAFLHNTSYLSMFVFLDDRMEVKGPTCVH